MEEKYYWLGFSLFPGVGPTKFAKLLQAFGSAKQAWEATPDNLKIILGEALTNQFILFRQKTSLQQQTENLVQKNVQIITLQDMEYPELLKQKNNPPFLFYVKGTLENVHAQKIIAVVGTRNVTPYGKEVTQTLTMQLVRQGFIIVSGLALGVDAIAHTTTVHHQGKTIAVLGCGVDCCTPETNQSIYDAILDSGGTIVSTFPPGTQAAKGSFPARNAIIAGLSQGVLVTEGTEDSGALITAQRAKELQRPVFSVPGPITSQYSKGANILLQQGAIAVTNVGDIIKKLGFENNIKRHAEFISASSESAEGSGRSRNEFGMTKKIPLIGLAKREETIITSDFQEIQLPKSSKALQLIMRIRDEAHRFAITYHRKLRSKKAYT
jgi:DNA processing protein